MPPAHRDPDASGPTSPDRRHAGLLLLSSAAALFTGAAQAAQRSAAITRLPARQFIDADGRRHGVERWQGKTLVLNVWATWCAPCREEMPSLARLRERLAGRPVEVVALNIGESENRIDQFGESVRTHPPIVRDAAGGLMQAWKIRMLPTTYLLDPKGRVLRVEAGAKDWASDATVAEIEALLAR